MKCFEIIFIYACMYHWAARYIETLSTHFESDTVEERITLFSFTSHIQFISKPYQTASQHHQCYRLSSSHHHIFSWLLSLLPKWFFLQSVFHTAVRGMFSDIKKICTYLNFLKRVRFIFHKRIYILGRHEIFDMYRNLGKF